MKAYIGLGSNLGDREGMIREAIDSIAGLPETTLGRVSSLYDTEAVGELVQPNFLNAVIAVETELTARRLLWNLMLIERQLGRVRSTTSRYGPRTIDLDMLFFGDLVLDEPELRLPHPEVANRAFVLIPLVELEPTLMHPVLGETVVNLLARLKARPAVRRMSRLQD
jgi:2-amino-4-hydroxy-6-hydroxymethyldihydropteridine diphosphokinase